MQHLPEEMDASCNIWLEKLGSQVKRNPAWWSRLKHEEGQHSHSAALPPSSSLSRLPCSTSLCLYGVQALCNPPAWIAVLYLCQLPSRERKTQGGRRKGSVHLRCVLLKCVFNMETESSMLQKKNQAAFNIYIFRNQLCRNRQSASLENLFLPSLEKTQDKLLRGRQNRERREKSKHSSYHTQVVLFLQSWISHPYLNTQSHQGLVFPRHKANRLLCFLY